MCVGQVDCAEIVLRTIREAAAALPVDASIDAPVGLSDCDKLIEKYAKLAFDFSAADHCNEPGVFCFLTEFTGIDQ